MTTQAGTADLTMSGVFDRTSRSGTINAQETLAGRQVQFTEVFSGLTAYVHSSELAALKKFTGGKPWLKLDVSRVFGAIGVGSLPTGSDPAQFLDFLRAVSSSTTKVGSATVRGVPTTHYHALIDIGKYPSLVPSSEQTAAKRSVSMLEQELGGHTLPMDAWVDAGSLVRRIGTHFTECVAGQHLRFAMTMDLFGYGPQPQPQLPAASDAYDITPLLAGALGKLPLGCPS